MGKVKLINVLKIIVDICGILGLVLSILNIYQTRIIDRKEKLAIYSVQYTDYRFLENKLKRSFYLTLANNSYTDVSVINGIITLNENNYNINSNNSNKLPLNLEANHTEIFEVILTFNLSDEELKILREIYEEDSLLSDFEISNILSWNTSEKINISITTARNTTVNYEDYIGRGFSGRSYYDGGRSRGHGATR